MLNYQKTLMHFIFAEACVSNGMSAQAAQELYDSLENQILPETVQEWVTFIETHIDV